MPYAQSRSTVLPMAPSPRGWMFVRRGLGDAASDALAQYESTGDPAALQTYYALKYPASSSGSSGSPSSSSSSSSGSSGSSSGYVNTGSNGGPVAPPPPLSCSSAQAPSTDPAVYSTSNPAYIKNLNLAAFCQQADRVNQNLAAQGNTNFVGVDVNAFNQWWSNYTPGQNPPPQNFWTGVSLSNPMEGVFADPYAGVISSPGTKGQLPAVSAATQQPSTVINSGAVPSTLPPAVSSNAPNSSTQGSGVSTSNGPGAILQSLGLSNESLMLIGLGVVALIALPQLMGGHR